MFRTLIPLLMACVTLLVHPYAQAETTPAQKTVLVTGASSALGRATAEMMAARGYFVYAGARKDADLAELDAIENIRAIRLDVNQQEQIDAAVKTIREAGRGLYGLVNNAGVAVLSPLCAADHRIQGSHQCHRLDFRHPLRRHLGALPHDQARHGGLCRCVEG
jgi:NADP-dependent 3-hydroxy acid dehydrogenase YdfG